MIIKHFGNELNHSFQIKKAGKQSKIIIIENDIVYTENQVIAEKLNNYFTDVIDNLNIERFTDANAGDIISRNIDSIVKRYESHPSIIKIKQNVKIKSKFKFNNVTTDNIKDEISKLNSKKASVSNDIPANILKENMDIVCYPLTNIYNNCIYCQNYPISLKIADVTPVYKPNEKNEKVFKKNYRPVSLIPVISKVFEKSMFNEINQYINNYLSPYLFGFRKGHSIEQCLLTMIELWRKALDNRKSAGAVLTDLSKAFDCLNHDMLIAKLHAYGFDNGALNYTQDYLNDRKQHTKIGNSFSSWREISFGVPQGSILGPLLFNIFINDIFYFTEEAKIANYTDDTTVYATENNVKELLNMLQKETTIVLNWFKSNEMKSNDDKCHLFVANKDNLTINLSCETIKSSDSVKLLGITIDKQLNFKEHVTKLCKKGNQKLHALARIAKYMSKNKLRILMKAFIELQFNYCPLVWMFHNRTLNNKINRLHERALRIVYKDENGISTFEDLQKDGAVKVHDRNLQRLAIEMFKVKII